MGGHKLVAVALTGALSAGCTHISTTPDRAYTDANQALPGVAYNLPMLQYDVAVTRTLTKCPATVTLAGVTALKPSFTVKTDVTATPRYVRGESYQVDYESLSSLFKTSSFGIENHPNGVLKSINVSAEDQTAEIAKDVVKTAISIAAISAGPAGAALGSSAILKSGEGTKVKETPPPRVNFIPQMGNGPAALLAEIATRNRKQATVITCTPAATAMVQARAANRESVKTLTEELTALNERVADLTTLATLKSISKAERGELQKAMLRQNKLGAEIAALDGELKGLDEWLAASEKAYWPRVFDQKTGQAPSALATGKLQPLLEPSSAYTLDEKGFVDDLADLTHEQRLMLRTSYADELSAYLTKYGEVIRHAAVPEACVGANATEDACLKASLGVGLQLSPTQSGLSNCPGPAGSLECLSKATTPERTFTKWRYHNAPYVQARDGHEDKGIFVRDAVEAQLTVCRQAELGCAPDAKNLAPGNSNAAPQLGQLRFLPFSNGPFEANGLSVLIRDDGRLEKFEYKRTKAALQTMAATGANIAAQIQAEQERREKEEKEAIADQRAEATYLRNEQATLDSEYLAALQRQIDRRTKEAALAQLDKDNPYVAVDERLVELNKDTALMTAILLQHNARKAVQEAGLPLI